MRKLCACLASVSVVFAVALCTARQVSVADEIPEPKQGCAIKNGLIGGFVRAKLPGLLRVSSKDGKLHELLPLPTMDGFGVEIETESVVFDTYGSKSVDLTCTIIPPPTGPGISVSEAPCESHNYTVVDNGPGAAFAGAGRFEDDGVVRVSVHDEKFGAAGIFTLHDSVVFRLNGDKEIRLPANGVEPVIVTARFHDLKAGANRIDIYTSENQGDEAPQGTVCL